MGVGSLVRVLVGQLHRRHDSSDRTLIPKDAPVREQPESPGPLVVHHSPTGRFLVLHVRRNDSAPLQLLPNRAVISGVNLESTIVFRLAEGGSVDDQFPVDQPKDAYLWWLCCLGLCLAPLAVMAGFHWHHRSIRFSCALGEGRQGIMSQPGRERSSPNGHRQLFVIDHAG